MSSPGRSAARDDLRLLFTLRPSPVRWPIGLQAAIAVGTPMLCD